MSQRTRVTDVRDVLDEVVDPCSCSTGTPVSVLEMGMIVDIEIEGEDVSITVLPTSITCPFFHNIAKEISERVGSLPGVSDIKVTMDTERSWSPNRMDPKARERLNANRRTTIEKYDLTPYAEGR